jgi:hypothetical protein
MSYSALGRIERGDRRSVGLIEVSTALAVVGLELSARVYPTGRPHRDRAHHQLLERLRARLPPGIDWRVEVPFPDYRDLRAWDAVVRPGGVLVAIEAETRPRDGQELERRLQQKRRDGGVDRLILLLADTRSNRLFARDFGPSLGHDFPVLGSLALTRLAAGLDPGGDSIILL